MPVIQKQAAFRAGRGYADQIISLRQTTENTHVLRRPKNFVLLDVKAAFQSVQHVIL